MDIQTATKYIARLLEYINDFWGNGGWAPKEAALLLDASRLDRMADFSKLLEKYTTPTTRTEPDLILAWVVLGSLTESLLKWFLSIFYHDYIQTPITAKKRVIEPDEPSFNSLIQFFEQKQVWLSEQNKYWTEWLNFIKSRRNTIHLYRDSEIGTWEEWNDSVITFLYLIFELDSRVPYPDQYYSIPYDIHKIHEELEESYKNLWK